MMSQTVAQSNLAALEDQKDCDVVFVVGTANASERISCHRFPLRTRSPIFKVMLADRWKTDDEEILIPEVEPSVFYQFLQFIYGDKFTTKIEEAINLLYVASKYKVTSLIEQCEMLMKTEIQLEDAIQIYQAARRFDLTSLEKQAGDLMAKKFFKLIDHPSFEIINEDTLLQLLPRNDLQVDELKLFEALLRWTSFKLGTRPATLKNQRQVLRRVLRLVRFPLMRTQDFAMKVIPTKILRKNESLAVLTYMNSTLVVRRTLRDKLGFPWHRRQPMREEYMVNFYQENMGCTHHLYSTCFTRILDHEDANRFSFNWNQRSRWNRTASITSVILRGPDHSCVSNNSGSSWLLTNTWTVSLKLAKLIDSSSGITAGEGDRKITGVQIFGNKDTSVTIDPPFSLQIRSDYLIMVSYSSPVHLPSPGTFLSTSTQDFFTSTWLKADEDGFSPFNEDGDSKETITCYVDNHSSSARYNGLGYNYSHSQHKSHCIRSIKLLVCGP